MLARFLQNHVLANLTFALVLLIGGLSYAYLLPVAKDPEINFNWVFIVTALPGASAEDVERRITDVLEEGIQSVQDIKFVSSNSRDSISSILIRFEDIDDRIFDRRINDLRREIQTKENELPLEATQSVILEITSSNAFPTASIIVSAESEDENLRIQTRNIEEDLERLTGVDRVDNTGLQNPELQILFDPAALEGLGISPPDLSDTVAAYFKDLSAGRVRMGDQEWTIRWLGTDPNPEYLANLPIVSAMGEVPLHTVADVKKGREKPEKLVLYQGKPATLLAIFKKPNINTLELVDRINAYVAKRNKTSASTGVTLILSDDQTGNTRNAISVMQTNALLGLLFVFITTWLFLGTRIALLTTVGIPFTLAGTFWFLSGAGFSINTQVLLGVVISLGMLVDDAVVVIESIYYRLSRGMDNLNAVLDSLKEVFSPVTASVATTVAAFLPLMLLPGILGEFMRVIPLVVTIALLISLFEAFWMLPSHSMAVRFHKEKISTNERLRRKATHWIKIQYGKTLIKVLRWPTISLTVLALIMGTAFYATSVGMVKFNFFALESMRQFYVNVTMPPGTTLSETLNTTHAMEKNLRKVLEDREIRAIVTYAGQQFTETEPLFGDRFGQIMISMQLKRPELRSVEDAILAVREVMFDTPGPEHVVIFPMKDGPPTSKPISVKLRGDRYATIKAASSDLKAILAKVPGVSDISDDAGAGSPQLDLRINSDAVRRAGLNPQTISRTVRLLGDGEIITDFQHEGDKIEVRVLARSDNLTDIDSILGTSIPLHATGSNTGHGGEIALGELVEVARTTGLSQIRHYNFRRAITVEADLDKRILNTQQANQITMAAWSEIAARYPEVSLDFSGELDDIQESLDSIFVLFLFGIGLIYLILGAQFKSYFQPFIILATIPMAFTGVVAGLVITGNPLSLYTLYGVVALAGIAVNAAIVLISAANQRLADGMSLLHATVYAARRRIIPILITTLTTIAGLFSLATGLGGQSLLWGPVATAMVWGLAFSSSLTLFVIPLLYRLFMGLKSPQPQLK